MAQNKHPLDYLIRKAVFHRLDSTETRQIVTFSESARTLPDTPDQSLQDMASHLSTTRRDTILSFATTGLFFALMGAFLTVYGTAGSIEFTAGWQRSAAVIASCSAIIFTWLAMLLSRESKAAFLMAMAVTGLHEFFALACGVTLSLSPAGSSQIQPALFWISLALAGLIPLAALVNNSRQRAGVPYTRFQRPKR